MEAAYFFLSNVRFEKDVSAQFPADEADSVSEARERRKERGQGCREGGRWRKEEKAREHRATKSERRIRAFEAVHVVALTWLISLQRR